MKMLYLAILTALAMLTPAASAQQAGAPTLDAEHRMLDGLAGEWTVRQSFWTAPGTAPRIDTGRASLAMVLGRHLRQSVHIDDGTHFEGLGYFGYDTPAKTFFSTWMDVNFPGIVIARGTWDAATNAITLRGRIDSARDPIAVREVLTITDRDHFRYDFYETHQGVEALAVRLDYTRA